MTLGDFAVNFPGWSFTIIEAFERIDTEVINFDRWCLIVREYIESDQAAAKFLTWLVILGLVG